MVGGLLSVATVAARRGAARRAALRFYDRIGQPAPPRRYGTFYGGPPGVFHQSEGTWTLHTASLERVAAVLPSDLLRPARLPGDKGIVMVGCMRHQLVTVNGVQGQAIPPYGEVMVAIGVTRQAAPPLLPLVAPTWTRMSLGAFVLHLPVTNRVARDGGRGPYGYPKFVADMEFEDSVGACRTRLSEGDHTILTQQAWPSGRPKLSGGSLTLYSVLDERLLALDVPLSMVEQRRFGKRGGRLELGDHQVADELRTLELDPEPFLTRRLTSLRLSLGVPEPIGSARPYTGYLGEDREFGRYLVSYPGTELMNGRERVSTTIPIEPEPELELEPEAGEPVPAGDAMS
jgi:hypothetical protein